MRFSKQNHSRIPMPGKPGTCRLQVRDLGGGEGFVEAVEPRRNVFSRPAAANIDQQTVFHSDTVRSADEIENGLFLSG